MSLRILNGQKIVISGEFGDVLNYSNSSSIVSVHNVYNIVDFHIIDFGNSVIFEVQFNGIVHLYSWVDVSEGSSVMGDEVANLVRSNCLLLDSAKFELSLLSFKFNEYKSSLSVVENSVSLSELRDVKNVHKS